MKSKDGHSSHATARTESAHDRHRVKPEDRARSSEKCVESSPSLAYRDTKADEKNSRRASREPQAQPPICTHRVPPVRFYHPLLFEWTLERSRRAVSIGTIAARQSHSDVCVQVARGGAVGLPLMGAACPPARKARGRCIFAAVSSRRGKWRGRGCPRQRHQRRPPRRRRDRSRPQSQKSWRAPDRPSLALDPGRTGTLLP